MLPSILPAGRNATVSHGERSVTAHFEKSPATGPHSSHNSHTAGSPAPGSPSAHHASPAISAVLKTPAVSANFAFFASPERRQRIDVQSMLNEIHSRPSMAGLLGTGIVSALSAKTLSETQSSKPLEVRANLDRFIRSKLQVRATHPSAAMCLTRCCRTCAPSRTISSSPSAKNWRS